MSIQQHIKVVSDVRGTQVARGLKALQILATVLPTARPFEVAGMQGLPMRFRPGEIYQGDMMIVGMVDGVNVYFTCGDILYREQRGTFASTTPIFNDIAKRMKNSQWLETLGEAELAFIFYVGCARIPAGAALALAESVTRLVDVYFANKTLADAALKEGWVTLQCLRVIHTNCPRMLELLLKVVMHELRPGYKTMLPSLPNTGRKAGKQQAQLLVAIIQGKFKGFVLTKLCLWLILISFVAGAGLKSATQIERDLLSLGNPREAAGRLSRLVAQGTAREIAYKSGEGQWAARAVQKLSQYGPVAGPAVFGVEEMARHFHHYLYDIDVQLLRDVLAEGGFRKPAVKDALKSLAESTEKLGTAALELARPLTVTLK